MEAMPPSWSDAPRPIADWCTSPTFSTSPTFARISLKKLGFDYDIRKDIYKDIQGLTLEATTEFFNKEVKTKNYNTAIIGKKESLDFAALQKLGEIEEVTLEEIFNY